MASSAEAPSIKPDQALPVPLGRRLVVHLALRKGVAVVYTPMKLELASGAGAPQQFAQLFDHRQRRKIVVLRAGDVELAFDFAERQVRALDGVADEPGAVERC